MLDNLNIIIKSEANSFADDKGFDMNAPLVLSKIDIREDYRKEWNAYEYDFVCLTRGGKLINNNLYRVGGLGTDKISDKRYFMLIKHVEAYYSKEIMRMSKNTGSAKHLESRWVIIDKYGNEKVEFSGYKNGYLVDGNTSILYSIDGAYYNIETGYCYGQSSNVVKSSEFVFIQNDYDKDESKRGIVKVNKIDGSFELFK